MATYRCKSCGNIRESRCKPKKCPECGESQTYEKDAK